MPRAMVLEALTCAATVPCASFRGCGCTEASGRAENARYFDTLDKGIEVLVAGAHLCLLELM